MSTLHIIHTNDLHSHFENWPTIVAEIQSFQASLTKDDEVLLIDLGDHLDRSHIFTEATAGKGNVRLLNEVGYNYVTIGNNEGITLSHEQLDHLYDDATFQVVLSNFFTSDGNRPEWVQPYHIYTTSCGKRIGLFGLTAAYDEYYQQLGWHVSNPIEAAEEMLQEFNGNVDLIVCLAHVGRSYEEELAERFPEIQLILGAHTHHSYPNNFKLHTTSLSAGGKWGQFLGIATIDFTHTSSEITTQLISITNKVTESESTIEILESLTAEGEELLQIPVFMNEELLEPNLSMDSSLNQRLGDALITYTGADCALYPAGLLLTNLFPGEVSAKMMHDLLPHPINPCLITCTGANLIEAYRIAQNEKWPTLEVKGLGFRGKQLGRLLFRRFEKRQEGYYVADKPLELTRTYQLVTVDMFTFGYFFPRFKELPKTYFMPETIRDVFIAYASGRLEKE
ncbi:bifunctional metallophosphatase/5'-nucleotidase [Chryseomicrobium palamuruense]|uniref:Bifunctional metallophosphatase/5'-nucleotidase n=1 Tax=Chryseomicrobium palamuruense TaxID=682973 RepID=A0ABV8UWZ5_9BACL